MDKVCKNCGHSCHCVTGDHTDCKCVNCDCKNNRAEDESYESRKQAANAINDKYGVVVDDTNECEWCQ